MNEWSVVTVIIALVGLFATIGGPIIKLNSNITLLRSDINRNTEELKEQKKELKEQKKFAHESHEKIWAKSDEQDNRINDHETRIQILENESK